MPNNWFQFKQFMIEQEHATMKVGTDGVLLGAWTSLPQPGGRVLDIGTGTGLIALMLAQRVADIFVDALEIDPSSAVQARENFQNSPWKESLKCIPSSFQDYASQCRCTYDLIICNPPFFTDSYKTPSREKNLARHDDSLSLEEILRGSIPLMKGNARLSLILPADKEALVLDLANEHQIHLRRITRVIPSPGKATKRILLEISPAREPCQEDELVIECGKRHHYSDAYKKLTGEFYLD